MGRTAIERNEKMLPEQHRESIINSGLEFLRAITEAYGSDEGMKLWDTIASTLDKSVKGDIFFAMISGEYVGNITIRGVAPDRNKIGIIKAIRQYDSRGLGLVAARYMAECLDNQESVTMHIEPRNRKDAVNELRVVGCLV